MLGIWQHIKHLSGAVNRASAFGLNAALPDAHARRVASDWLTLVARDTRHNCRHEQETGVTPLSITQLRKELANQRVHRSSALQCAAHQNSVQEEAS
jgi:hypothetical protein